MLARRTLWYFFIGRADPEKIALLQAPNPSPAAITTNLGLDKFYHRL